MATGRFAVALAATVLALSGCAQPSDPVATGVAPGDVDEDGATGAADGADATLEEVPEPVTVLVGTDCVEGGSHSAYSMGDNASGPVAPWEYGDAHERLGRPTMTSTGPHTGGAVRGNWAPVFHCASWESEGRSGAGFVWSFTATLVAAPSFDPGGADHHYLAELFSVSDTQLEAVLDAAGIPSIPSSQESYEWIAPDVLYTKARYGSDVEYESWLRMRSLGSRSEEVVRLWIIADGPDGDYRPVSLDLHDAGGTHLSGDSSSAGMAYRRDLTGGQPPFTPGAPMAGLAFEGFQRTVLLGPQPDEVLGQKWER